MLNYILHSHCSDVLQTQAMIGKYSQLTTLTSSWLTPPGQAYGVMKEPTDVLSRQYMSYINDGKAEAAADTSGTYEEPTPISTKQSDRKAARGNTKQVLKKKWENFRKDLDGVLYQVHASDHKPQLTDILSIIFQASQLEPIVENPGETFMSTVNGDLTELQRVSHFIFKCD